MTLLPLIGHHALRARLEEQAAKGALPASLLLQGPPGIGKQRLALWLAQRLLCSSSTPPCGECQHCKYVLEGAHPDLQWFFPLPRMKGGSDPTIENVRAEYRDAIKERVENHGLYARPDGSQGIYVYVTRALMQEAVRSPAMAQHKVIVVGDAERMVPQVGNPEAANAFLKLLEEPPANTTIILTTSEPGALLPTIRSRVVSIRAAPLADDDVRAFLAQPPAADAAGKGSVGDLVRIANGAPGTLIGESDRSTAVDRARKLLDAASSGRDRLLRAAFTTGSSKARGAFSDVLDAMTVLLHERARDALTDGNGDRAAASVKAVRLVEEAKRSAEGNVNPQLVTAHLLRELEEIGV